MVGVNVPFMVRQAHHERKIRRLLNPKPFALSLSTGEWIPAGYILWRESPNQITESLDGALRVKNIVADLKCLAGSEMKESVMADVNKILKSSHNIVSCEIKNLADTECELQALNSSLEARIEEELTKNRTKDLVLMVMHQEKLSSVGRLAAGMAHEINNPISFVTTNLRVLSDYLLQMGEYLTLQQEFLAGMVTEEQRRELTAAALRLRISTIRHDGPAIIAESLEGVQRVARIVSDLKSFSRVDTPDYEPAELTACLESALTIVATELKQLATVDKEYRELPTILCHPAQLNQVFLNLLHNAGQAVTPPGRITLKSWFDEGFVYASVEDNGHGIPEELRERIFDPFFTTRDVGQGTGLGLSISHNIITNHHGELAVESVVGVGTTFTVKLPRTGESL